MNLVVDPLPLSALNRVAKSLEYAPPPVRITGLGSCVPLAILFTQNAHTRLHSNPHVVVFASNEEAQIFMQSLLFFDPTCEAFYLPAFDVDPYSNLYPKPKVVSDRVRWLNKAWNAKAGQIFVATAESISQKTLPFSILTKSTFSLRRNSEIPSNFVNVLNNLGYQAVPTVEDVGTYSTRGGILDIFSPAHPLPFRLELFGDLVESLRTFDPQSQISVSEEDVLTILPPREVLYFDGTRQTIIQSIRQAAAGRNVNNEELSDIIRSVSQAQPFYGMDYLLPYFYEKLSSPLSYFSSPVDFWIYDHVEVVRSSDLHLENIKQRYDDAASQVLRVPYQDLYQSFEKIELPEGSTPVWIDKVEIVETSSVVETSEFKSFGIAEFSAGAHAIAHDSQELARFLKERIGRWRSQGYVVLFSSSSSSVAERLRILLERAEFNPQIVGESELAWSQYVDEQKTNLRRVHILTKFLPESFRLPDEGLIFVRDEDILGKRRLRVNKEASADALERSEALSFGDLKVGDLVVHKLHGIGVYEGLRAMNIEGAEAEFIELKYRDNDKLYLPVYRIGQLNKYVGPATLSMIDKLGGTGWQRTKTKVKNQLRDVADNLLQLYAARAKVTRPPFASTGADFQKFESSFPYQETEDQLRSIEDILRDLQREQPMDRLVCGDVGFGKTEVAMRATFQAVHAGKQVAVIAPTTILTHQHFQNFKKRFSQWPIEIRVLNRFVGAKEIKNSLTDLAEGRADIVIGTHRLLSKDVKFKNLGLLVVDEEQKFGVIHKERLRRMRENVDTLAMSATPIPRTLNMSLVGIRDLSIINTPPEDRLPTRTFVCKYEKETIRKAMDSEISRGGQIFFLHNRVQSIDEAAARIREIMPSARIAIAHGQMPEDLLEKTMLKFFSHELDILVCTAIIESGMDIPRANTIFIDNAHTFGVGQLYQLRGRVGRSKERAYCYLILPAEKRIEKLAQERLRVIQENTALGSGLKVAQYDLELRGAGDILGEDQSGHINAVGYELYMELLEDAVREKRGQAPKDEILEPEINLRIPALLPDKYVPDIRMRLYYYKTLSNVKSADDIERIEQELRDQFGPPPDSVFNLLGLMLVRKLCRELGVKDIGAGKALLTLAFTDKTTLPPNEVIKLTTKENKKYQLTPDQRLKIRMQEVTIPRVVDELEFLIKLSV